MLHILTGKLLNLLQQISYFHGSFSSFGQRHPENAECNTFCFLRCFSSPLISDTNACLKQKILYEVITFQLVQNTVQ